MSPRNRASLSTVARRVVAAIGFSFLIGGAAADPSAPLKVAVYDVAPYGSVEPDGSIGGVSVDLWRRAAERLAREYRLVPVNQLDAILEGLERGEFDAAIGAITITPERLARVDFSYPAHRSGVAVAFRKRSGPLAAFFDYGAVVADLSPLIAIVAALLVAMGVAMWLIEKPMRRGETGGSSSSVASLRDGVYWAVVTMTTVGYGDKTPKTAAGHAVAVLWMLLSVALISLLSTALVSKLTAERVASGYPVVDADLMGKRLSAVAHSSGAEYLDSRRLPYAPFDDLPSALTALESGRSDAVVNSIGTLRYLIAARYPSTIEAPQAVLAPSYMAFALPPGSALKKPLDRALIEITTTPEWRKIEDSYFGR